MKTETRRMRNWWMGALLLWLAFAPLAQAFYNPSTGKWLSRDPIGELGGENLYAFANNNPLSRFDPLGLSDLEFSSEGRIYLDPRSWTPRVDQDGDESGKQRSPDAWFWQRATEVYCPNGLCNSGGEGNSSSFVKASVKNKAKCVLKIECTCTVSWAGSTFAPKKTGIYSVKGHVLDTTFAARYVGVDASDGRSTGWWVAAGADSNTQTKTFLLAPRQSKELYNGYDYVSQPPDLPGAGFYESMKGTCSCSVK